MSLLMDALKKAEEEKKQAAKRLQEVEMEAREPSGENDIVNDEPAVEEEKKTTPELYTDTSQLSLEPLSLTEKFDETKEASVDDSDNQIEVPVVDETGSFSEDPTIENTILETTNSQAVFEDTQKAIDLNDTTIIEGLSTENASAPFDDTFHGVVFEEDEQETDVYEETLPGVPADQLAKDLGGGQYQPTPVAAKTVFSAGRQNKKQSSFKWSLFIVLALLAVGSFAIFYYFTVTPVSRSLPSPIIARGIESSDVKVAIMPPALEQSAETEIVTNITSPVIEESQPGFSETIVDPQSIAAENIDNQDKAVNAGQQADIKETVAEASETKMDEVVSVDEAISDVVKETKEELAVDETSNDEIRTESSVASLPEDIQVDSSLISISKSKKLEQENVMISQAFKAYQDGHYDAAKSIYEGVLKNDPDNRDAHLGLGAIAISHQDRKSAYSHYVYLLELNPLDTLAMSALIGLSNSADPVKDESAIKLLLQREGDMPYLYFSLGNLYAKQQRWTSAQQAFFDAYRLDTTNADYVLNLAISLDQIGQYDSALDFYKTAIDLSQNSSTRFDPVPVNNRIFALSKLIESKL